MVKTGTLTALFHELVRTAMTTQRVTTSETTEFYLVQLLETFARPGRTDLFDPPLGLDYREALRLPPRQRHGRLRRVADTALFVSGVFFDSLERRLVGPRYFATLGRAAYAHLSHDARDGALADPFEELAGRFPQFVRVLADISDREIFRGRSEDTVRLYKRWLHTRGAREADQLVRRGVIPAAPDRRTRH
jgi:hypothetical protein